MYEYLITYSYWEDNRRVKEKDIFYGDTTQEAVDNCRSENHYIFSDKFGRIENVYKECEDHWEAREDWE